jgi:hypothetical protein
MKKNRSTLAVHTLAALSLLALCAAPARAAIIVVAPTTSTNGSLTVTNDITFPITTGGNAALFALDEWVTSDGTENSSPFAGLLITLDGGAPFTRNASLFDNLNSTAGAVTPNDGYIFLGSTLGVVVGDTVTLDPGTYTLGATAGFNPQTNQTFTGNMFIADNTGTRLSDVVSAGPVPEPATCTMLLFGGLAILHRRRFPRTTSQA